MTTNDEMKKMFSTRLSDIMKRHDITQVELARKLDVSESTVGKWLLMKAMPRMGIIQKLADYFGVGKSYFLEENYTEGHYINPDAAEYAEACRTNPNMRVLFSTSRDISKESMEDAIKYIEFLKSKEKPQNQEDFVDDFSEDGC